MECVAQAGCTFLEGQLVTGSGWDEGAWGVTLLKPIQLHQRLGVRLWCEAVARPLLGHQTEAQKLHLQKLHLHVLHMAWVCKNKVAVSGDQAQLQS